MYWMKIALGARCAGGAAIYFFLPLPARSLSLASLSFFCSSRCLRLNSTSSLSKEKGRGGEKRRGEEARCVESARREKDTEPPAEMGRRRCCGEGRRGEAESRKRGWGREKRKRRQRHESEKKRRGSTQPH